MAIRMTEKAYRDFLLKAKPVSPAPKMKPIRASSNVRWFSLLLLFMRNFMRAQ